MFVLITCYTTAYDYNNPCVEIVFTENKPVIVAKSGNKSFLVGTQKKQYLANIKRVLNAHNEKALDGIVVTDNENETISHLITTYDRLGITQTYFCNDAPRIFKSHSRGNINKITIGGKGNLVLHNSANELIISSGNKKVIIIDCDKENDFKNPEDYDIIILYGEKSFEFASALKNTRPDLEPRLVVSDENKQMTIYFE